jgi:hypothetical protein
VNNFFKPFEYCKHLPGKSAQKQKRRRRDPSIGARFVRHFAVMKHCSASSDTTTIMLKAAPFAETRSAGPSATGPRRLIASGRVRRPGSLNITARCVQRLGALSHGVLSPTSRSSGARWPCASTRVPSHRRILHASVPAPARFDRSRGVTVAIHWEKVSTQKKMTFGEFERRGFSMKMLRRGLLVIFVATSCGCGITNLWENPHRVIEPSQVSFIKPGVTTAEDLRMHLGKPHVRQSSITAYLWDTHAGQWFPDKRDIECCAFAVKMDEQGRVIDSRFISTGGDPERKRALRDFESGSPPR